MGLRALTPRDRAAVARFAVMASLPPDHEAGVEAEAEALPAVVRWLDDWGDELGVCWEDDGTLVGAAWARHGEPVLAHDAATGEPLAEVIIAVAPEARDAGVGTTLMQALMARAAAAGGVGLSLTVGDTNSAAMHVYAGAGFVTRGRTSTGQLLMVWQPAISDD